MQKIVTIIGARPQFIKACVVSDALSKMQGVKEILVHTGQHYDEKMSDIFMKELFSAQPDINLNIGSGNHGHQTAGMLTEIEKVLIEHKPNCVVIYGDTNSTLAGALAAAKLNIPVAHVEAGLRSYNREMPEEINRIVSDHVSDRLYTPTTLASENLKKEGISTNKIIQVGDLMYDVALRYSSYADKNSTIIKDLNLISSDFILVTIHRPYNTDIKNKMKSIVQSLNKLSEKNMIVFPIHPRTKNALEKFGLLSEISRKIKLIEPVGYIDMVKLEKEAKLIITDSGGVQKEAYFHKKPCITLRTETEWVELVDVGWNKLADSANSDEVVKAVEMMLNHSDKNWHSLYGNGNTSELITRDIMDNLI